MEIIFDVSKTISKKSCGTSGKNLNNKNGSISTSANAVFDGDHESAMKVCTRKMKIVKYECILEYRW